MSHEGAYQGSRDPLWNSGIKFGAFVKSQTFWLSKTGLENCAHCWGSLPYDTSSSFLRLALGMFGYGSQIRLSTNLRSSVRFLYVALA